MVLSATHLLDMLNTSAKLYENPFMQYKVMARTKKLGRTDGRTDVHTDGWMDVRSDGRKDAGQIVITIAHLEHLIVW